MTYEELKSRLSQVETALQSINGNNAPALDMQYTTETVHQLTSIKESLIAKLQMLEEGDETMFVSTKGGDTKAVTMDRKAAMDLKKDPAITGIDTAKGATIKETDRLVKNKGIEFTKLETTLLAKEVGKAVAKALKALGDEVGRMKAIRLEPNSFEIEVTYKGEVRDDEFSFYVSNDELHLVDFTFDKVMVSVGAKPSGEPIINVDVLTNELQKHWKSFNESSIKEGEGDDHHYIKVKSNDYKKAMAILDQNVDPTYVKMDVVDDDGAGNTIIYFMFKHEAGFDDMYDDSENPDSEFYQEPDEDPQAFIYDVVMDLRANDIELAGHSAEMDEAADNSDWAMKIRNINQHGRNMKQVDKLKKSEPTINPDYKKAIGNSPRVKAIIDKLEAKRAQVMRDMEQEAEPQGGPISDKYGDMLNKIDTALEKARGGKVVHYDDRQVDTSTNENAIDPAEYGDIGKAYLAGFKKQHTLTLDQLEQLGRKIVNQLHKGDFEAAKAKHLSEAGFSDDSLFTFGFDLDEIQYVVDYLQANYSEQDYELHVGRGDTHPNAVTLNNPKMEYDAELGDLLDGAKGSDQTDYEDYRREEDDYANNELPEELEKGQVKKVKKIVGQLKKSVKGHGAQAEYLGSLIKENASRNLDEIFGAIGYRQGFDEFIEDNPGAVEVLMEWIGGVSEFRERISNEYSREEQENLGFYYGDDDEDGYDESTIKEGRGDLDTIARIITDMAAEDGTTPKEAALEIIEALRDMYIIDAYDESVNESLNPEVSNKVNQFIKAMAKRYGYEEQDAVYAIMAALKQRDFDGVKEGDGLWANINAKKKRGEKASHGNSKAFKAAKKAGKALAKTKEGVLKEFTDQTFKGSEIIDMANKNAPDMFGKQIFADLLPKGMASENAAIEALKAHDKSPLKHRMGIYAPMFVHVQYHNLEHEGEEYQMHQTQYYNGNFKDKDPNFNPRVSRITLFKDPEGEDTNLGMILVKTGEYVQDLNVLPGLGKRVSEVVEEQSCKVGDTLTKDGRRGKVIKHSKTQATVDFGNGDVYGIAHSRIKDGKILKESKTAEELKTKIAALSKARAAAASSGKDTLLSGIQKDISKAQKELKKLGKLSEATRQDLGIGSSVSKRRAKAELKKPGNDGSKVYGLDKDGKRVHIKNINDVDKFKKFELDADLNENKVADKDIEKEIKSLQKENPKGYAAEIKKLKVRLAAINLSKKKVIKEEATCCGKCGRVHVKGNCKRPYLKGAKHCRTK
tara:strand:+ start:812 stop:4543 length:3732 start_codon:yes stop_codon:yes gene_type:complete